MKRMAIFLPFGEIGNIFLAKSLLQLDIVFTLGEILFKKLSLMAEYLLHYINHLNSYVFQ